MDFSLPRLFVVKNANTLPTTGTTADLTADQFGVFRQNYTPATAANAAASTALFLAQGRSNDLLNMSSLKGNFIKPENVISKYVFAGANSGAVQISTITGFTATKGGQYNITIRAFSNLLDTSSKRGMVGTYTVNGPCLECGDDPCEALTADETEDLVHAFYLKMVADKKFQGFLTFAEDLDGVDSNITVTGVAQPGFPRNGNLNVNDYQLDAVTFAIFAVEDAPTTQDYEIPSPCDQFATVAVTQTVKFARGTYEEVRQAELDLFDYSVPQFGTIYSDPSFNGLFSFKAETGIVYDQIVVRAIEDDKTKNFGEFVRQEFTNIIYCPTAKTAGILAILEPKLGTFEVKTPA